MENRLLQGCELCFDPFEKTGVTALVVYALESANGDFPELVMASIRALADLVFQASDSVCGDPIFPSDI